MVVVDDWTLRHLQTVIVSKLRRGESVVLTWTDERSTGERAIWISERSVLHFSYDDAATVPLNRTWLRVLADAANSNRGLRLLPEPPS